MGNISAHSFSHLKRRDHDVAPQAECKDVEIIKKIWQAVEIDCAYYGFAICNMIFKNHPQYVKYFEDESIPEFIQESKVKKKFTAVCDIICALFVDYNNKPAQKEYLLGYIAMVHKDMGLTLKDFENFIGDVMEVLVTELPYIMTEEYIVVQMSYFQNLVNVLLTLMKQHEESIIKMLRRTTIFQKCCKWCADPESQIIYGYSLRHWLYKKQYWEYRRAIWAVVEMDMLKDFNVSSVEYRFKYLSSNHKVGEVKKLGRRKRMTQQSISSDSNGKDQSNGLSGGRDRVNQRTRWSELLLKEHKDDNTQNKHVVAVRSSSAVVNRKADNTEVLSPSVALQKSRLELKNSEALEAKVNHTARERKRMRHPIIFPFID